MKATVANGYAILPDARYHYAGEGPCPRDERWHVATAVVQSDGYVSGWRVHASTPTVLGAIERARALPTGSWEDCRPPAALWTA